MTVLPLPTWEGRSDDAARVVRTIDEWASSVALSGLVDAAGGDCGTRRGGALIGWLDEFSERWDVRRGAERDAPIDADVDRRIAAAVLEAAAELGLADRETPRHSRYDAVVMTGGMVRAGIVKPRFVRSLLDGGLEVREAVFVGAFRPFSAEEARLADALGVPGDDEWDAMMHGVATAFDLDREPDARNGSRQGPSTATWNRGSLRLSVVAAPSSHHSRRADTADTFRFWGSTLRAPASVLVVTTPVYVPYQATVAVEVLGLELGHMVETIGASAAASDLGGLTQPFLPQHHLQELRSAIRAMRRLRARASRTHQPGS